MHRRFFWALALTTTVWACGGDDSSPTGPGGATACEPNCTGTGSGNGTGTGGAGGNAGSGGNASSGNGNGGSGGQACKPDCVGKACGDEDGCGAICETGTCPEDMGCDAGECRAVAWTEVTSPTTELLWAVRGTSADDVWAVGDRGVLLHYDGTSWEAATSPVTDQASIYDVWGSAPDDVWAVSSDAPANSMMHYDGSAWTSVAPYPTRAVLTGLWGMSGDAWAVGLEFSAGAIVHLENGTWTQITKTTVPDNGGIEIEYGFGDVWGSAPDDVWAVGQAGIWHFDGSNWTEWDSQPEAELLRVVQGASSSDVWIVGEYQDVAGQSLLHFDGGTWSDAALPENGYLLDVWAPAEGELWAVGEGPDGGIFHWDGQGWTMPSGVADAIGLQSVWGSSPTDIWAVGRDGRMWHYGVSE